MLFIFPKVTCFCLPALITGRLAGPCVNNGTYHSVSLTVLSNVTVKRQMTGSHTAPVPSGVCFVPCNFQSECQAVANRHCHWPDMSPMVWYGCGPILAAGRSQGPTVSQVDNWKRWFTPASSSTSLFFLIHFILGYQLCSLPEPQTVVQCSFLQPLVK
jgi:hypothetical protein